MSDNYIEILYKLSEATTNSFYYLISVFLSCHKLLSCSLSILPPRAARAKAYYLRTTGT